MHASRRKRAVLVGSYARRLRDFGPLSRSSTCMTLMKGFYIEVTDGQGVEYHDECRAPNERDAREAIEGLDRIDSSKTA